MSRGIENILFTSFVGLVIVGALFVATDWPVRASIIVLLLGSIGIVLAAMQLVSISRLCVGRAQSLTGRPSK